MTYDVQEVASGTSALVIVCPGNSYNKVLTAIEELNEQFECRTCGRKFTVSPKNLDLCARCSDV
jgi:Zn finger protein HypA/HybF involved in hydrogenase expression